MNAISNHDMVQTAQPEDSGAWLSEFRKRLERKRDHADLPEAWIQDLRENAEGWALQAEQKQPWTLKAKLFPLTSGSRITLTKIIYSESLWAAGTLAMGSLAYFLTTFDFVGSVAFVLVLAVLMAPLLVVWALVGLYLLSTGANTKPKKIRASATRLVGRWHPL